MLPLRYPKIWSALGWLLIVGVIFGSLLPGSSLPMTFGVHDKLQHAAAYGFLTVWFTGFYRRGLYLLIAVGLFALGVALDLLQSFTATRSLDWYDVVANVMGIAAGLVMSIWFLGGWGQRLEQRLLS